MESGEEARKKIKVNISVVGRFHVFDLAKELNNEGVLNKLITTYPKFKASEWGVEKSRVVSEVHLEVINRYRKYIPFVANDYINFFIKKIHDKNVRKYIKECDVFIGWSGSSLLSLIEAKKRKKLTILERGSAHYSYVIKTLTEEFKKINSNYSPNYRQWQQELLEYELADFISVPSSFVKRSFIEYGVPEDKLLVNPYGVDLSRFKKVEKKDDVFRVIFCGALSLQKGSHYLLEAFYNLGLENVELWHIGNVLDEMKPFIDKYKSDKIIYKGSHPQVELHKLYSQGSVFILPSIHDGFGMVIFQAMACGLPVILSENTGAYDVVTRDGEEGFVIPVRDVGAIRDKVSYLYYNEPKCKEMGLKAQKRVSSGYTWEDYGKRYVSNLNKLDTILDVQDDDSGKC